MSHGRVTFGSPTSSPTLLLLAASSDLSRAFSACHASTQQKQQKRTRNTQQKATRNTQHATARNNDTAVRDKVDAWAWRGAHNFKRLAR
jgi:hypothetical protein